MKTKALLILLFAFVVFSISIAQNEIIKAKNKSTEAISNPSTAISKVVKITPIITEECLVNINLFNELAKKKQFADAYIPWAAAYKDCPNANKAIYTRGREILQWKLGRAQDIGSYKLNFDILMGMYDSRIKYFGNDQRYPTPWILGLKALDYIAYVKVDTLKSEAYNWLEQSIYGMGENSELEVLRQFFLLSTAKFKADKTHSEKYIADYLKSNVILELNRKSSDTIKAKMSFQLMQNLDFIFVQSGAANCKTLDVLYKDKIQSNIGNLDFLNSTINLYKRIDCRASDVYNSVTIAAHKLQPTVTSANSCAELYYKNGEFTKAITFYDEATKLATDKKDMADYQFKIAQIYYGELKSFKLSRDYALNSLEFNPNNGNAYMLIGYMYAKTKGIYENAVLAKTVYWVAVDKFKKAKEIDPSLTAEVDKLILSYSSYFPTKEDVFFQPELQAGKSFFVGGWINESTICR